MPTDSLNNTRKACFAQVSEVEKQLWARIRSHGVLDTGVKGLYHKACCIYEKLFLNDNQLHELQNIEYLLWRLHYKHIDEFRKTICQTDTKGDSTVNNVNVYIEGFKLFLSHATKFYQDIIRSIKRYNGLIDEPWFYKNDGVSGRFEQLKLHKCQFVCHRLCICLGDLARYLELYEKPSHNQRNWSFAASYYLEAAKIYPDGGNPQNQLAVLATYIGEEFLALYHCIRSLAVKEPFPDALQNLMLLFEKNKTSNIVSLSDEVYDFSKPSDWISSSSKKLEVAECSPCGATDFWTLFIRMTSFFFLESGLESFACTFSSTLREFEALLAVDVSELNSALQSYQNMNLLKAGPYRVLYIVSVLLFVIHNLTVDLEQKIWKPTKGLQSELVRLALTVTFIFMGRLVDRCLKGSPVIYFPLLPALLVFVEWLVGPTAISQLDVTDEMCQKAMCYFFGSFIELLKHLQENSPRIDSSCNVALWEDYELRGFIPLFPAHELLDFSSHWEDEINYKMKNEYRAHRIVQAAIKIASINKDNTPKWLFYDQASKKFRIDSRESNVVEEEEDIVFKPITRRNSEPITFKDGEISVASDECLRRASSLLVAQNRALIDSLTSPSCTTSTSPSKQPGKIECIPKVSKSSMVSESIISAGPPSLSSWVQSSDITKKNNTTERNVLTSIPEISLDPSNSLLTPNVVRVTGGSSMTHETPNFVDSRMWGCLQSLKYPSDDIQLAHNDQYYPPRNLNSVYGSGSSGIGLLDHWSHNDPLGSLPTMYSEDCPPLFHPSPSLLYGLHEQRKDAQISVHHKPDPFTSSCFTGSYMQK